MGHPGTVATPVQSGSFLFVSSFYNGGLMMALDVKKPAATMLWQGKSSSEIDTDTLHSVTATPVVIGDHIYSICSYGQFRCLLAKTGQRLWESQAVTQERARWAAGQTASALHGTLALLESFLKTVRARGMSAPN